MINKVRAYIASNRLLDANQTVLVALSGGADSVALLHLLRDMEYKQEALHCNFRLRGAESDRDEVFVRELCQTLQIPLSVCHFDTQQYATSHHISIEMAARELRYAWFAEELEARGAQAVAVAHHMDDQAETLLLNLIRGSGLQGLSAMKPKRDYVVRPLLCVQKTEILEYLSQKQQNYVTDSTNLEAHCTRNLLRLEILPLLAKINPQIVSSLAETSKTVLSALPFYHKGVDVAMQNAHVTDTEFSLHLLEDESLAETLLYEWCGGKGFSRAQLAEIIHSTQVGKVWESSTHRLLRDREKLFLKSRLHAVSLHHLTQQHVSRIENTGGYVAYFDAAKLCHPIVVRTVREGDWFVPFGMTGRKLVSDFLTDCKLSVFQKEDQQVATCGNDIIWVIGLRSDNRYRFSDETTDILKLSISES